MTYVQLHFHPRKDYELITKLARGHVVTLHHKHLHHKGHGMRKSFRFNLAPRTAARFARAMQRQTGVKLHPGEIRGGDLKGVWNWIKGAAKKVGNYYTEHIKPYAAPLLKKGAQALLNAGETALEAYQPELAPAVEFARHHNDYLVNKLGSVTGAYGLHIHKMSPLMISRLKNGHMVQLRHEHLGGAHGLHLHHETMKKLHKAHRAGRGVRISLSPEEMEMNGEGLKEAFQKAKHFYKEHIHKHVAPHLKRGLHKAAEFAHEHLAARVPEAYRETAHKILGEAKRHAVEHGEHFIGSGMGGAMRGGAVRGRRLKASDNQSQLLSLDHPAMNPVYSLPPIGREPEQFDMEYERLENRAKKVRVPRRKSIRF